MPAKSLQLCLTLCDPMDCSVPGSSVHGIFQAKILEWVVFLQGIFPTWELNLGRPHCRQILYSLSHQESVGNLRTLPVSRSMEILKRGNNCLRADS